MIKSYSKAKRGNEKLSEHFTVYEFCCRDGSDSVKIDLDLLPMLEHIRTYFGGKPVIITCGYRTDTHNKAIGGANNSLHTTGQAVDFYISGVPVLEIAQELERYGAKGIGCYYDDKFIHLDTRASVFRWKNQTVTPVTTFLTGTSDTNYPPPTTNLYKGVVSYGVKYLQNLLNKVGYNCGDVDGIFGAKTDSAVRKFQADCKITVDGIVGTITLAHLHERSK